MPIVIGNWKMNGNLASLSEIRLMASMLEGVELGCNVVVCPPATMVKTVADILINSAILVGGQDCHTAKGGAFTGDISAEMLKEADARFVILGHSERRSSHQETDQIVAEKAVAAYNAGLIAIICVGESATEREQGDTLSVIRRQIAQSVPPTATAQNTIIAYEPVWAIGSGQTPSGEQIEEVHAHIRTYLAQQCPEGCTSEMRIVYGGSLKAENASEILKLAEVDGGLVGQASLSAKDFLGIIKQYAQG